MNEEDAQLLEVQKLNLEIQNLKTKLRMTKSDRDMISKYTSQINRDMSSLQEKYNEMCKERDYYVTQIRDVKNSYTSEIFRLEQEAKHLGESYQAKCQAHKDLILEHEELKSENRHVNFELDVLQVDYHNEKEHHNELLLQMQGLRRKYRNLQGEFSDADRAHTKLNNRLVDQNVALENERSLLQKLITTYEQELERLGVICFVCRLGIKSVKCSKCVEQFCSTCWETMDACPFCRTIIEREESSDEDIDEEGDYDEEEGEDEDIDIEEIVQIEDEDVRNLS